MVDCPYCAELIDTGLSSCPHCQSKLTIAPAPTQAPAAAPQPAKDSSKSTVTIILLVVGATVSDRLDPSRYSQNDQAAALLLGSLFFVAAVLVCRAARLSPEDRSAITIEASLRNINLGILVKASLFPASEAHPIGDAMLFALAYFGGVQMVIAAIPILTRRFGFVP